MVLNLVDIYFYTIQTLV